MIIFFAEDQPTDNFFSENNSSVISRRTARLVERLAYAIKLVSMMVHCLELTANRGLAARIRKDTKRSRQNRVPFKI